VVTAVVVAHDGATWLPRVIQALLDQTRPVQRVVAVDTGSRDRSGSVLASQLGQSVVFGMDRGTGYGAAVARALQHRAANANIPGQVGRSGGDRVEWVWLLHDDCEPAPDALEQLLRGAAETRAAAVLGPKVMDWADRQVILEAGITIDTAGRRITGVEPREVDQGQHDGDRDCLAVSSPGMLVRRDVWDSVGGFDPAMALFREDVDFCWRVHAAGYRVRVITDAIVYHAEASARRRRPVSVARRPRQLDRTNAMLTLIGNLPAMQALVSAAGNLAVSILRALFFLLGKRLAAGLDELAAVGSVLGHPLRLLAMRRRRARGRRAAYGRLRRDLPPGRSLRRIAEFMASAMSKSGAADTAGSHHATDDPDDADYLLTDIGLAQRIMTHPGVLLFLALTAISLVAERSLLGSGPIGGGELIPAWGGASGLWHAYLQGFHPVGIGSGSSAPAYLAIIAALATVLGGKPWLAVDVIMLGCVPLAGISAFLAAARITRSTLVRVWAAASYALLPVAMGAVAAGRIGTAVVFVLIPVIALQAGRMLTQPPRRARRAAWATGLAVAIAAAFVPLVWVVAAAAAIAFIAVRPAMWRNLGIVAVVPPVLLLPWTVQAAASPSALLLETGVQQPGLAIHDLSARSVMLLSPGGPGLPPIWVTAGIALAALAGLLLSRRRGVMLAGWGIALGGLLIAVAVSRVMATPTGGGPAVAAWPGVALLIAAVGLLLVGVTAGEALPRLVSGKEPGSEALSGDGLRLQRGGPSGRGRGGARKSGPGDRGARRTMRGVAVTVLAIAACSAPVLAAGTWLIKGVQGPVSLESGPVVPAVVAVAEDSGLQLRTLVLRTQGGQVNYSLQRGTSPSLGDPDLMPVPAAQSALNTTVAALVAPNGGEAVDQGQQLAQFDIGFVLLPAPVDQNLARLLNGVSGLRPVSATSAFDLWRLSDTTARVRVVEPDGTVVPVSSGPIGVSGARVPAAGGQLELAEPSGSWSATLNGRPLSPVASSAGGWAQAFQLPAGGGVLGISRNQTGHDLILVFELLALIAVAILALPGSRTTADEAEPAVAGSRGPAGARTPAGAGARARAPEPAMAGAAAGPGRTAGSRAARPGAGAMAGAGVAAGALLAGEAASEAAGAASAAGGLRGRFGRGARGPKRDRDTAPGARPGDRRSGADKRGGRPADRRRPAAGAGAGAAAGAGAGAGRDGQGAKGPRAARGADERPGRRPDRRESRPQDQAGAGRRDPRAGRPDDEYGARPPGREAWSEPEPADGGQGGRAGWPQDQSGAGAPGRRAAWPENEPAGGWSGSGGYPAGDPAGGGWSTGAPRSGQWPEQQADGWAGSGGWPADDPRGGRPDPGGWPDEHAGGGSGPGGWQAEEPARGRRAAWPENQQARGDGGGWEAEEPARGRRAAWPENEPARGDGWAAEEPAGRGIPWPAEPAAPVARAPWPPEEPGAGARRSPSGTWPPAEENEPWTPGQQDAWAGEPSGWTDEHDGQLDPLPPPTGRRHRRPAPGGDDDPGRRPGPDRDSGGDGW
jgi:GT2 family glycosyltransferase